MSEWQARLTDSEFALSVPVLNVCQIFMKLR